MLGRLLASLLFAICLAGGAEAQVERPWSTVGSNCVPADATVKFNRDKVNIASVQHAVDNVDLITLNCPVTRFSSVAASWNLVLAYRDSTATATTASVRARLYRMPIGGFTPVLMAEANSNNSGFTGNANVVRNFAHTFNFDTSTYWVHVDLDRSSTSQVVIFHSVHLEPGSLD